jgi:hypothetical protein
MRHALLGLAAAAASAIVAFAPAAAATLTQITPYADPLGGWTTVSDINDAGWMTGTIARPDGSRVGFVRDPFGNFETFAYNQSAWGRSIDNNNRVTVWGLDSSNDPRKGLEAIRDPNGSFSTLFNPADNTPLHGIPGTTNSFGTVVGDFRDAAQGGRRRGFILDGLNFAVFDVPGAALTAARGINDAGVIAGFYGDNVLDYGFIYAGGVFTTVMHPDAEAATYLQDINNSGLVAGNWQGADDSFHPFVYDVATGKFTDIDVGGDTTLHAWGIDNKGRVILSTNPGAGAVSYLYDPTRAVPEPATWLLTIAGFTGAGLALRRARRSPLAVAL